MAKAIQKDPSVLTALGSSSSVRGAGEETIRRLYEQGTLRRYDKNESVLHAKKHTDYVCFLISGKVIEYNMTLQGKRKILFVLGEGALLNDCIVTNTTAIYCDTIEPSAILQVPNDRFERGFSVLPGSHERAGEKIPTVDPPAEKQCGEHQHGP